MTEQLAADLSSLPVLLLSLVVTTSYGGYCGSWTGGSHGFKIDQTDKGFSVGY